MIAPTVPPIVHQVVHPLALEHRNLVDAPIVHLLAVVQVLVLVAHPVALGVLLHVQSHVEAAVPEVAQLIVRKNVLVVVMAIVYCLVEVHAKVVVQLNVYQIV